MIRPVVSLVLASLILVGQVGLPLHLHYCKGILESISVFGKSACEDHEEVVTVSACCRKAAPSCEKDGNACCNDQTTILTQDLTSLLPQLITASMPALPVGLPNLPRFVAASIPVIPPPTWTTADLGPPIYIRHQALIFYA